jgi:[NiFe] hydrogenase assembly HybE family chaperone
MDHSEAVACRLQLIFQRIERTAMAGIPILNSALSVQAVGVRKWQGEWLAVLITPWFMNLILLPEVAQERPRMPAGTKDHVAFPSGSFEFIHGFEEELGPYRLCSLFSPMFEFADQESAEQTARHVLAALFDDKTEEDEDGDMARIWAGHLPEEEATISGDETLAELPEPIEVASGSDHGPPQLTRRFLFGLRDEKGTAA